MKFLFNKLKLAALLSLAVVMISSCAPEIKLTSSWTNNQAKVKSSPAIMVIALGKANSSIRQDVENSIVKRLNKYGYNAVPATGLFQPGVKHDSAEVVRILRENNIDMLLTNAVVGINEQERFIPGAIQGESTQLVVSSNYYSYYTFHENYRTKEAPQTPGTTVVDVQVKIESRLFEVSTPQLIWHAQSMIFTKEPSKKLINAFSKTAVDDILKNKLLVK
jgi:hypothetical protein